MEEQKIMEQPKTLSGAGNVGEQNLHREEVQPYLEESGSTIGKFKDPASLLLAYNNLEKAFTKKSQKLAELLKANKQNSFKDNQAININQSKDEFHTDTTKQNSTSICKNTAENFNLKVQDIPGFIATVNSSLAEERNNIKPQASEVSNDISAKNSESEGQVSLQNPSHSVISQAISTLQEDGNFNNTKTAPNQSLDNADNQEQYKQKNWTTYAKNFLSDNPDAKNYASEIFELIRTDKQLALSPNCLEYAYAITKQKHTIDTETLLADQSFISEHILTNNKIRELFIKDYLTSLENRENIPRLISGTTQNLSVTTPAKKPKTIKDASNILKKLLNY